MPWVPQIKFFAAITHMNKLLIYCLYMNDKKILIRHAVCTSK